MENPVEITLRAFFGVLASLGMNGLHERRQKKRLKAMLSDDRFPKGFRSTDQLMNGIGADRPTAERLLLAIGARKSENSDEWTRKPAPGK